MRIIALINQKGGVGKTTSAVNLGAAFCRLGHRVLLMDMDPQANLTLHCDVHGVERSVYDALVSDVPFEDIIVSTQLGEHLDLAPSNIDLSAAESELASLPGRERRLRRAVEQFVQRYREGRRSKPTQGGLDEPADSTASHELSAAMNGAESTEVPIEGPEAASSSSEPVAEKTEPATNGTTPVDSDSPTSAVSPEEEPKEKTASPDPSSETGPAAETEDEKTDWLDPASPYDFILIDCPPSLGLLSINALALAQEVLIPLQMEFFALQGMARLMEVLKLMRRRLNPELRVGGIIPCMYDGRTNLSQEVLGEVREYFGELVFKTRIRENIRLAEAPSHGRAIFDYSPSSNGAQDYQALAQEVLTLQEARQQQAAAHN